MTYVFWLLLMRDTKFHCILVKHGFILWNQLLYANLLFLKLIIVLLYTVNECVALRNEPIDERYCT